MKKNILITGAIDGIGIDILAAASLSDEFVDASGKYFDNDLQIFTNPNKDAMDHKKNTKMVEKIENIISLNLREKS